MELFASSWERRDREGYEALLADDFQFVFAPADSSGSRFPGGLLGRNLELTAARALFETGSSNHPRANSISFRLTSDPGVVPDSRPGKQPTWHQEVHSVLNLTVRTDEAVYRILARLRAFLVRGDSASLPHVDPPPSPDTTHWYLERIEELGPVALAPTVSFRTLPSVSLTWGGLKAAYLKQSLPIASR